MIDLSTDDGTYTNDLTNDGWDGLQLGSENNLK